MKSTDPNRALQTRLKNRLPGLLLSIPALALALSAAWGQAKTAVKSDSAPTDPEKVKYYEQQVKPILKANCYGCHESSASGGFLMNSRAAFLKGGVSGTAVTLAKPGDSLFLHAVRYENGHKMPPQGRLPQAKIDILAKWVAMGLPWTLNEAPPPAVPVRRGPPPVNAETMKFWSFQPVKRAAAPRVKNAEWVRTPIDAFVLAKLESNGLKPAPAASRIALLRRASYDLIGLPPTPEEVSAFLADASPNAWEKVVDRLLASPHYGERWGRHWLDLVRYAETNSFERDDAKPFVWRYRDYVIRSLNSDKPYDQFVKEQLAGDELAAMSPKTINAKDALIATGYYRLGQWDDEPVDADQARYDELDDIVATTGQVFLGLTVNCARCHDHKIDPIPQKDYYRMVACFNGINRYGNRSAETVTAFSLRSLAAPDVTQKFQTEEKSYKQGLAEVNAKIGALEKIVEPDFSPVEKEEFTHPQSHLQIVKKRVGTLLTEAQFAEYSSLNNQRRTLMRNPPLALEQALCVTEAGRKPIQTNVLMRGNAHVPGDEVEPGFPSVLAPPSPDIQSMPVDMPSSGRRLALANWIASPTNQLTSRVMVNRIWQFHFGRGIVRSSSNFGFMGTAPTHPELLDWLASEFTRNGWRMKPLHKLIMMSNAYKMSSQAEPKALAKDPENDLLWRFDMRRLDAEEIRDSILAVNGTLNTEKMFGPSIYTVIPKEVLAGQSRPGAGWGTSSPEDQARRSIYIHVKRSLVVPMIASFDGADTDFSCPVRFATTQPTQALSLMNSQFSNEQAKLFADYLHKKAGNDPTAQVKLALWRVTQRTPAEKDVARGLKLMASLSERLKREGQTPEAATAESLRLFCVVALNLNEFIYLD